jgi:hypothetical protein
MRYLVAAALAVVAAGLAVGLLHHDTDPAAALRIAFVSGDHVDEIDLAGGHRHTLRSGARVEGSPAVSPDGTQRVVSVLSATGQKAHLWVVDVDGSGRRQLTSGAYDILPAWSPDGSTILFTRFAHMAITAEARSWLETVPATGGTPRQLTSSGRDGGGVYSPDGRSIVFGSARDKAGKLCGEDECQFRSQLYVMAADGSAAHRITSDFLADASPVFASNTTIVYSRADTSTYTGELYRIDIDGSCRRRLTHDALGDAGPVIVPGPSRADLPCPSAHRPLPPGSNFNAAGSTLTPETARAWRGLPLYWLGDAAGPFVLSTISVEPIHPPERPPSKVAYVIYTCLPANGDCARRLQVIMTPVCARPTFPATGRGAIGERRGVPRIRYLDRDELLVGRTIVTISGDAPARELAEHELRSFSASAGQVQPGQPLPAPPEGILDGLACQPPAISGAPLPAHP